MKEPSLHLGIDLLFARPSVLATEPLPHLGLGELEKREGHAQAFSRGAAIGIHADILQRDAPAAGAGILIPFG
jgi:hypothetical protein